MVSTGRRLYQYIRLPNLKPSAILERERVAQNPRLERNTPITSGPGDPNQSNHPSNANLHYGVFQTPQEFVQGY